MLKLIGRLAAGLGASALVAAAGLAVAAAPASAAPGVDLGVTVQSGVVASGSAGKPFLAKVTSLGGTKADSFDVIFDLFHLDKTKVSVETPLVEVPEGEEKAICEEDGTRIVCELGNVLVRNDSLEIPIIVTPKSGATGAAGHFTVEVVSDEDTNKGNNSTNANVAISTPGVDIVVWAEDVVAGRDEATGEVQRVAPGNTAEFEFGLYNAGSLAAQGVTFTLQLPEHVTFVETLDICTMSSNSRTLTCNDPEVMLPDEGAAGKLDVKVSANAPQSVELKGSIEGRALGIAEASTLARRAAASAPAGMELIADFDPSEIDNKDNTDDFLVFVGATTGGGGGGLPVTGPKAIAIGGVGAAVLAVGVFLFVSARRRRVVLVTPAD